MIIGPYGEIINESDSIDDDMIIADIKAEELELCTGRRWIRGRRPELYKLLTEPSGNELNPFQARFNKH